jgi:WD40 repeat protein
MPRRVATSASANRLEFLPDGRRVVAFHGSSDGDEIELRVYEIGAAGEAAELGYVGPRAHDGWIQSLAVSPDGTRVMTAAGGGSIKVWSIGADGSLSEARAPSLPAHEGIAWSAEWSHDGSRLATADASGAVRIWSAADGQLVARLAEPDVVRRVAFSPDDRFLLTAGMRGVVTLWSVGEDLARHVIRDLPGETGERFFQRGPGQLLFDATGERLFVAGGLRTDPNAVSGFRLEGGAPARDVVFRHPTSAPRSLALSPDGRLLASAALEPQPEIIVWDITTGERRASVPDTGNLVRSLAFSPDGATLVSGAAGGEVRFWDVEAGGAEVGEALELGPGVFGVAFTPDGSKLVASGDVITVWSFDQRSRRVRRLGTLKGRTGQPLGLALSPDGRRLAEGSAGSKACARLWDLERLEQIGPDLDHDPFFVFCVAFSPDGSLLASGGGGSRLRVWDARGSGRLVAELPGAVDDGGELITGLAFSPDGELLASGRSLGDVTIWNVGDFMSRVDLSVFAGVVDLEDASGGAGWTLRSALLRPPSATRPFVPLGPRYFPFLEGDLSPRQEAERRAARYLDEGNVRAAHGALASLRDPPATPDEWGELAKAVAREAARLREAGDQGGSRALLELARSLANDHPMPPEVELELLVAENEWGRAAEVLSAGVAALAPAARERLVESFFAALEARLAALVARAGSGAQTGAADASPLPEPRLVLASALKDLAEGALDAWSTGLEPGLTPARLEDSPLVRLLCESGSSPRVALVEKGAVWRYFPGDAAPAPEWSSPGFDDSAWPSGPADIGFGTEAAELNALRTVIPRIDGRMSYYFRCTFEVDSPPLPSSRDASALLLSLQRDDGAVLYLNGEEIHRERMPAGRIDHGTPCAGFAVAGDNETLYFDSILGARAAASLRSGTNTLAVEVHQFDWKSTDLHLDLSLALVPETPVTSARLREAGAFLASLGAGADVPAWIAAFREGPPEEGESGAAAGEPRLWYARSRIASVLGDLESEERSLERAIELAAASTSSADLLAHLELLEIKRRRLEAAGDDARAAELLAELRKVPRRPANRREEELDLGAHYNFGILDGRGWHEPHASALDLAALPRRLAQAGSTAFDARGKVLLASGRFPEHESDAALPVADIGGKTAAEVVGAELPERADGIRIGRACSRLHALVGVLLPRVDAAAEVARLVVHYADGSSVTLPVKLERRGFASGDLAYTPLVAREFGSELEVARSTWTNPEPGKEITSVDFVSSLAAAAPFLVAITVE